MDLCKFYDPKQDAKKLDLLSESATWLQKIYFSGLENPNSLSPLCNPLSLSYRPFMQPIFSFVRLLWDCLTGSSLLCSIVFYVSVVEKVLEKRRISPVNVQSVVHSLFYEVSNLVHCLSSLIFSPHILEGKKSASFVVLWCPRLEQSSEVIIRMSYLLLMG